MPGYDVVDVVAVINYNRIIEEANQRAITSPYLHI